MQFLLLKYYSQLIVDDLRALFFSTIGEFEPQTLWPITLSYVSWDMLALTRDRYLSTTMIFFSSKYYTATRR